MSTTRIGLLLNFIGAVLLGLSSQFGFAAGLGGPIVWKGRVWPIINIIGWCLLAIGFLMQLFGEKVNAHGSGPQGAGSQRLSPQLERR